ncbi:MAG: acyl-CoA thioesterase [Hyphomicrobiaceae bacterium]|nr:acyl-CoA thioesterase [Hyphomicrobiaceae bacterium]
MFTTTITPRVSETDGAGHINNVFVPVWFEAGRREIFRILTPDLSFARWRATLVNMNVDYLEQIYLHEDVEVRTWVDRIGTKSFTVYEEIWQSDRHCAKGTATYVYFNIEAQQSEPIPTDCRDALDAHLREK